MPVRGPNTRGATGWALEAHDLAISKYVANSEKDRVFLSDAIRHQLLKKDVLLERLARTQLPDELRTRIRAQIEAHFQPVH